MDLRRERTRFIKFLIVGTIGAVVDFGSFNLLTGVFRLPPVPSSVVSFLAAVTSNFFFNRHWTYPDSRSKPVSRQAVCSSARRFLRRSSRPGKPSFPARSPFFPFPGNSWRATSHLDARWSWCWSGILSQTVSGRIMMWSSEMTQNTAPAPMILYTTGGDMGAFLVYPYLFNPTGEWVGYVTSTREVYSLEGVFVGSVSKDQRIVRKKYMETIPPQRKVPAPPPPVRVPASVPLPPHMAELSYDYFDVLEEKPELLHTKDHGEFRPDAD
jgi:hypothetical protein